MSEEQKPEQVVEQVQEEPKPEVEQPKPESPKKITVPPKKKEKDPKKVAQGKRLAQISEKAKRDKMRRKIEEESQIDFSVNYNTLLYFGVPSIVFAGMYLYFSAKNSKVRNRGPEPGPRLKLKATMRNQSPSTSAYSINHSSDFYLYRLRKAHREFRRCQHKKQRFEEKHLCEKSPFVVHDYRPYRPFLGCFKHVCRFCLQESPDKNFQPSVYSFKGRTFEFKPNYKRQPPREYRC